MGAAVQPTAVTILSFVSSFILIGLGVENPEYDRDRADQE